MALIIGTTGDDAQIIDLVNQPDTIYGDQQGTLTGVGGDDRIFGRDFEDTLIGDADSIAAGAVGGSDLLVGGAGGDSIFGDALFDLLGTGGNDLLRAGPAGDTEELYGDARTLRAGALGGDDRLEGAELMVGDGEELTGAAGGRDVLDARGIPGAGATRLYGDASNVLSAGSTGGSDGVKGGTGDDRLYGDAPLLTDTSSGGDDYVTGNGGDDFVLGDAEQLADSAVGGEDEVRGSIGDDEVYGDAVNLLESAQGGDDQVYGGGGDDRLWGDGNLFDDAQGGNDVFNFAGVFDDDVVFDFRQGEDQLAFLDLRPIDVTISVSGGDSILSTVGGDSVTVVGYAGPFTVGADIVFLG
jgi:serralysin